MDFQLSEEQVMLKKNARDFLQKEVVPMVDDYEKRRIIISHDEVSKFVKMLTPLGYIIGLLPQDSGGLDLAKLSYGLLLEELAYVWSSLSRIIHVQGLFPTTLATKASEALRIKYLSRGLSGDVIGCEAISEPEVGSAAPRGIQTKAVLEGNEWVINGNKIWITNGSIADVCIVFALTDQGVSSLLVDKRESPFVTREIAELGNRCVSLAELTFDNCRIPKDNLLGAAGSGPEEITATFAYARSMMAIRSCGMAQAAIDASVRYARQRKQFGKLIGGFQLVQEMICDMVIETECARFLALNALDRLDKGLPCRKESSMAKAYGCEMAVRVTQKAIQIHGAIGLTEDLPVERYFRDAAAMTIPDGTTEIQKLIIGREIMGISAIK